MTTHTKIFDSPEDYHEWLSKISRDKWCWQYANNWGGNEAVGHRWPVALERLKNGDDSAVPAAQKIMDQITEDVEAIGLPMIISDVIGFMPNVPAVLAGVPETMFTRHMRDVPGLNAPLRLYIETSTSGGVTKQQYLNLGIALIAFTLYMQSIRPLELYLITCGLTYSNAYYSREASEVLCVKMPTSPVDLARVGFMLTDITWDRRLAFTAFCEMSGYDSKGIGWPWNALPGTAAYERNIRHCLSMNPEDLYFTGTHLTNAVALTSPVQWVKEMIKKHTTKAEA